MHWIDWLITIVPVLFVLGLAVYCKKYIRGVADYLAAGRVAGRYVMCVAGLESGAGVMALVAMSEAKYQTGFAMDFWSVIGVPVGMVLGLTGYCFYRYRETNALSMGQFLEMRYSRSFRIFAAAVRTFAEMVCNAIGPAVTASFFVYFLGIPHKIAVAGFNIPTFALVVGTVLAMAIVIMWFGGRLSLMVTDCIQGLLSYPIFVLIVVYVLWHFSWGSQISPTMTDRVTGESFLNPFKMGEMRDFNIFAVAVGIFGSIMNRAVWVGNDGSNAGRTPHEQKMSGILATWRGGFSGLLSLMVAIAVITFMCHQDFSGDAKEVRVDVARRVAEKIVPDQQMQDRLVSRLQEIAPVKHQIGVDPPFSQKNNADTPFLEAAHDTLGRDPKGNQTFLEFSSAYHQMMMPLTLRKLLPVGMTGLFALLMVMTYLATDTSRMFNSSSTLIQDVVLPLRKEGLTPEQHVRWLRWGSVGVAVIFFVCSLLFTPTDFLWMFTTIVLSIWLGGAGAVMIGGLYTKFGNTVGAYAAIIVGAVLSVGAIIVQQMWPGSVYPWLERRGWVPAISAFMEGVTKHTDPWVVWHMDKVKFPINSIEISFVVMLLGMAAYVIGSLLTYRGPFNLERMLHRGQYNTDGTETVVQNIEPARPTTTPLGLRVLYNVVLPIALWVIGVVIWNSLIAPHLPAPHIGNPILESVERLDAASSWQIHGARAYCWVTILAAVSVGLWAFRSWLWRNVISRLLGIDSMCTRGDRILIWSVFFFSIVYQMVLTFIVVWIWNAISPWPDAWWSHYFYVTHLLVPAAIGVISTVWFLIGGLIDTRQLFRDLAARVDNPLDDGRVQGHVALAEVATLGSDAKEPDTVIPGKE